MRESHLTTDEASRSSYLPQIDAFSLSVTQQSMHACSNIVPLIMIRNPIPVTLVSHEGYPCASLHLLSECVTCRSNQLASITAQDKTEEGTRDQTYIIFTLLHVMMSRLTASSPS